MSYPGDQQQPGGWGFPQPPQSPYDPVENQTGHGGYPHEGSQVGGMYDDRYDDPYGGPPHDGGFGAGDPYGGGPGGYGPAGDPAEGSPRPDRKRLVVGVAIVAGLVVVGGGTAFALASAGGGKPKPAAAPTSSPSSTPTASPTPSPTETGRGDRLASRATDPRPLTLNEVFRARTFRAGGRRYFMTGRRSERKCTPPTHGAILRRALVKAGCTQVLRATFSNGKFIGTIGVLNLRSQAAASYVQVASRRKDSFILALPGVGTTRKIGQGLSLTTAEVDGHYLIMSWVQYPNGKQIAKSDYPGVTSFVRVTTYGSNLRTALNYRSMEGKPA